ncbi:MAG: hypothetical protein QG656_2052, partial [Candidatus Hydrogenedentes bacterium]|nr:hypothetical protein [Candidatus Hydrogenedentota bacterium]
MMCPNGRVGSTIACLAILVAAGCSPRLDVTIEVADEAGHASIRGLSRPIMTVLSKAGCLNEPRALGWDDAEGTVQVTMLSDLGGRRVVVHCGGDSMLGRRYEDPAGEAGDDLKAYLIQPGDGGSSARTLVEYMAPMFGSADLRTLNIETAVGRFPDTAAYPGKRWILRTDPDALAAMDELGVDAVLLGNNHLRDFLDAGIASTLDAAAAWELDTVGGGMTAEAAESPLVLERRNSRIGILAYTSVDGSYVNDSYPVDEDPVPETLDPSEAWQWEAREWGLTGGNVTVPTAQRRIGSAWVAFKAAAR